MEDITDTALGISAGVGIALCGIYVLIVAWRQSKIGYYMKQSRSDTDISTMVSNSDPIIIQHETPEPPPSDEF